MRHVFALVALLALAATATSGQAAKPKPWQWTPQKAEKRLTASSPIVGGDVGSDVLAVSCFGKGRGVAGRFSRFICEMRWGSSNGSYTSSLTIRILARGTGKLCVVTTAEGRAVPYEGAAGPMIVTARACPR